MAHACRRPPCLPRDGQTDWTHLQPGLYLLLLISCPSRKLGAARSFTPLTMLQTSAQAIDFTGDHHFGEGQRALRAQNPSHSSHHATSLNVPSQDTVLEVFSANMLRNRVDREAKLIAEHFDALVQNHILDIDLIYSSACKNLIIGKRGSEKDHDGVRTELAFLLTNQLKSFTAAFSLLRTGWRLQPFLCIRNSYEALSVVLHLSMPRRSSSAKSRGENETFHQTCCVMIC